MVNLDIAVYSTNSGNLYVTRYSKRYLKSAPLVSDLQSFEANQ